MLSGLPSNALSFDSIKIREQYCGKEGGWFEEENLMVQLRFGE